MTLSAKPLVCCVALGIILTASPQSAASQGSDLNRFSPLIQGGYWEYELYDHSYGDSPPHAYVSIATKGDTSLAGQNYTLLIERKFDAQKEEISNQTCGIRINEQDRYSIVGLSSEDGSCILSVEAAYRSRATAYAPTIHLDTSVVIGGKAYDVPAIAELRLIEMGTGGSGGAHIRLYAEGIGQIEDYREGRAHHQAGGGSARLEHRLIYAHVGGHSYGTSVVSTTNSAEAAYEPWLVNTIAPNPFRDEVRVSLKASVAQAVTYTVYDVLGRQLLSGDASPGATPTTIRLDPGPAGIYFIEFRDEEGRREVRQLVRLPSAIR